MDAEDTVQYPASEGSSARSDLENLSSLSVERFLALVRQPNLSLSERGIRNARRKLAQNPQVEEMAAYLSQSILAREAISLDLAEALLACLDTRRPDQLIKLLGNALLTIAPSGSSAHEIAVRKTARTGNANYLTQPEAALPAEIIAVAILTAERTDGGVVRRGMFRKIAANSKVDLLAKDLVKVAEAGIPLHGPTVNMILMALQRRGFHDAVIRVVGFMALRDFPAAVHYDLNVRRVEALISIRRNDEAKAIICNELSEPLRLESWAKLNAWLAAQEHDFDRARDIFKTAKNPEYSLAYVRSAGMDPVHQPEQPRGA